MRTRHAAALTVYVYREYPVRVAVVTTVVDAVGGLAVFWVAKSALLTVGAILAGIVVVLLTVFVWALLTTPRHLLQARVAQVEDDLANQKAVLDRILKDAWGEVDQFVPLYHDLRADLGEAIRKVERARETGQLWAFIDGLDDNGWKKNRERLANHPWAKADNVYGPCADAFGHIDRLKTLTSTRWRKRVTRPGDDLDAALEAMELAERQLALAIAVSDPDQPQLDEGEELP